MRMLRLVAGAALFAAVAIAPQASAAPPSPHSCTTSIQGSATPANAGGLFPTGSVVTVAAEVVCPRDLLNTTPNELLSAWGGHISIGIWTDQGALVCGHGPDVFTTVGAVLTMAITDTCVLAFDNPHRARPMVARVDWATLPPYNCCGMRQVPISPVGAGV